MAFDYEAQSVIKRFGGRQVATFWRCYGRWIKNWPNDDDRAREEKDEQGWRASGGGQTKLVEIQARGVLSVGDGRSTR